MLELKSLDDLEKNLIIHERSFLLLYKKGNQTSDCAYEALEKSEPKNRQTAIFDVDVNIVKDIHPEYSVETVPALIVFEGINHVKIIKGCQGADYYESLINNSLYKTSTVDNEKAQKRVTVYSTPTCSWCNTLKRYFDEHGVTYTDVDVSRNQKMAEEMVRKSGQQGVPQTDIDGNIVVGFDQVKINNLLGF